MRIMRFSTFLYFCIRFFIFVLHYCHVFSYLFSLHVTSNLLENMSVSVGAIQSALKAFLAPYADKGSCFFGTPAATHLARCLALE